MDSSGYLGKITSAHTTRTKFMEWLKELLDMLCELGTVFERMNAAFSADEAIGNQLNTVGITVGAKRVLPLAVDDEDYRKIIYAKIMRNMWDGTNENLSALWKTLYPELEMQCVDNQDMTVSVYVYGIVSDTILNLIPSGQLIPRPMGVAYNAINVLPPASVGITVYAGTAMIQTVENDLGATASFGPDDVDFLTDENDEILLDSNGIMITL